MKALLNRKILFFVGAIFILTLILSACSQAMPTGVYPTDVIEPEFTEKPPQEVVTQVPEPTVTPVVELRVLELEWPATLKLGDSDLIRLSLIPSEDGYIAKAEYGEHNIASQDLPVEHPEGYNLRAIARLDGAGFAFFPYGDQRYQVRPNEAVTWRWSLLPRSSGKHRVSITLRLQWEPDTAGQGSVKEALVFDRSLEIKVISFLGLRKPEAAAFGFIGLAFSCLFGFLAWRGGIARTARRLVTEDPDSKLSIETPARVELNRDEEGLMRALFKKYQRLVLQSEFMSGYSGARTFLATPVKSSGQSDADTIIKIGLRGQIEIEYEHYETYVKDRLPPITARIQSPPITLRGSTRAAMQYTCIAEPGKSPISLRRALLADPDPALIQRLFDIFASHWWMQRQPYTFRLAQEYDRLLPPHLVLEPASGLSKLALDSGYDPSTGQFKSGDLVVVHAFDRYEVRADEKSLTLYGVQRPGKSVLRVRWLNSQPPSGTTARIVALRSDLLAQHVAGFNLFGLPDPLQKLETWLDIVVQGTRSVIHGDLNLENILVGPGNLLWLIDFAQTREGHPLFDFSHLASEMIAQILVEKYKTPQEYLAALRNGNDPLLNAIEKVASMCLFDPKNPSEYHLALILACLGALKYRNLDDRAKQYLYLTAAFYGL